MSDKYYYICGSDDVEGPFASIGATKAAILAGARESFNSACRCLQGDGSEWGEEHLIVKVVATVKPIVKATVKLEEVQP